METGMCAGVCIYICICMYQFRFLVRHYFVCSLDNGLVGNTICVSILLNRITRVSLTRVNLLRFAFV